MLRDNAPGVINKLRVAWTAEMQRAGDHHQAKKQASPPPRLWYAVFDAFRRDIIVGFLWALAESATFILQPVLLRRLLLWLQDENEEDNYGPGWCTHIDLGVLRERARRVYEWRCVASANARFESF